MTIETHLIVWNRADTISLTVKHYKRLGKVFVYDNFSDDNTRNVALASGAEVIPFGKMGVLDDAEYLKVKNNCWKGSTADWVIVVDDDEILWHPNLIEELQFAQDSGATIIQPQGFCIFSEEMPVSEWTEIMTGIYNDDYSKLCCFDPKAISEINYEYGCHRNTRPVGKIRLVKKGFLLHYADVGGAQRKIDRHKLYEPRRQRSQVNMRWGLGKEYGDSAESKRQWFQERLEKSAPLSVDGLPS